MRSDPGLPQALCADQSWVLADPSKAGKPVLQTRDLEPREAMPWGSHRLVRLPLGLSPFRARALPEELAGWTEEAEAVCAHM